MEDSSIRPAATPAPPGDAAFQLVKEGRVKKLLPKARKGLPGSCSVFNVICLHIKFENHYDFFVPCEKSLLTIVMWKRIMNNIQCVGFISNEEPSVMANLLETTELFNWTIPVMFFHVPENLSSRIALVLRRRAGNKVHTHTDTYTLYTMEKTRQKNIPLRCPKGYKICQLDEETMRKIHCNNSTSDMDNHRDVAENIPCIGLFMDSKRDAEYEVDAKDLPQARDNEEPLAFIAVCRDGAVGLPCCKDKHWVDGLMALLVQTCGRMMVSEKLVPHMYVEMRFSNTRSLMDTLPGWKTQHKATRVWSCFGLHCPPRLC